MSIPVADRVAKPVRLSVDLAPAAYRQLREFCTAPAVALEQARVAGVRPERLP